MIFPVFLADLDLQAFSLALAVTNIVGVPVGGFGVPFPSLSNTEAQTFLKVCTDRDPTCAARPERKHRSCSYCNFGIFWL